MHTHRRDLYIDAAELEPKGPDDSILAVSGDHLVERSVGAEGVRHPISRDVLEHLLVGKPMLEQPHELVIVEVLLEPADIYAQEKTHAQRPQEEKSTFAHIERTVNLLRALRPCQELLSINRSDDECKDHEPSRSMCKEHVCPFLSCDRTYYIIAHFCLKINAL